MSYSAKLTVEDLSRYLLQLNQ